MANASKNFLIVRTSNQRIYFIPVEGGLNNYRRDDMLVNTYTEDWLANLNGTGIEAAVYIETPPPGNSTGEDFPDPPPAVPPGGGGG